MTDPKMARMIDDYIMQGPPEVFGECETSDAKHGEMCDDCDAFICDRHYEEHRHDTHGDNHDDGCICDSCIERRIP